MTQIVGRKAFQRPCEMSCLKVTSYLFQTDVIWRRPNTANSFLRLSGDTAEVTTDHKLQPIIQSASSAGLKSSAPKVSLDVNTGRWRSFYCYFLQNWREYRPRTGMQLKIIERRFLWFCLFRHNKFSVEIHNPVLHIGVYLITEL